MIIGIDPGLSGAMAWLNDRGHIISVYDMPTMAYGKTGRKQVNAAELARLFRMHGNADDLKRYIAIVEQVSAFPGQGVCSMFSFGQSFGVILGVLGALEVPYITVAPKTWKKFYGLGKDKEEARAKAIQCFPTWSLPRKKDAGRAEAMLLARFGKGMEWE